MTPAWIVCAWPPILWQASRAPQLHLTHLGTRVLNFGDESSPCTGQTLWGDESEDHSAGVAWDWVRLMPGVVAMSDPLGLVTNLKLLDDQGEALTNVEAGGPTASARSCVAMAIRGPARACIRSPPEAAGRVVDALDCRDRPDGRAARTVANITKPLQTMLSGPVCSHG